MEKTRYYAITVRKFSVLSRHLEWMEKTQTLYNEVLAFYYNLFLDCFSERDNKKLPPYPVLWRRSVNWRS